VAIILQFFAFGAVVIFLLYDGKHTIAKGARGVGEAARGYLERK
jgi:hypothetical protein